MTQRKVFLNFQCFQYIRDVSFLSVIEVVEYRVPKGRKRRNEWQISEIMKAIEGKKGVYKEILQRNVTGKNYREEK